MFSQPNYLYNGAAIGTASEDNARHLNNVRVAVAGYYDSSTRNVPCVDTYPPSQTVEACATTTMARFTAQCNRRPTFVSSYMDQVDSLSVTACADLCLSRFSCRSFTHLESNGRCQLYAKPCKDIRRARCQPFPTRTPWVPR